MTENFEIKSATKNDAGIILELIKEIAAYEKLADQVEATEEQIINHLFSEKTYAECIIGFENNIPIGFALFFHNYSTFVSRPGIYLEDLFVKEKYRGKGYGKKLLLSLVKIADERNCGRVEWSVLDWNKPAIDFYESLGATPMNEWTVYRLNQVAINKLNNK
ncbi:MAG: N-acetyltransferase family protein [Candidatus Methylacidiphilales bacterium]